MVADSHGSKEFGKMRNFFWPIHRHELKKLLPMLFMSFLIGFAYHILRITKDSLLVTVSGAEVIPFVKVWAMLPMAILLTSLFVKLAHRFTYERVFYIVITSFLVFYIIFAFVLYPLRDVIHPHQLAAELQLVLPKGFGGLIAMVEYWSFSLFYAISEMWGTIVLIVLFWGFANEVTKVSEANRFYAIIGIGANMASIFSGSTSTFLCNRVFNPAWPIGEDLWHQSIILITLVVVATGLAVMALFRWFNQNVIKCDMTHASAEKQVDKVQSKGSIRQNIAYLFKSKYLIHVAIIVLSYNILINLSEVLWKDQLRSLHPDPNDYSIYMSGVTMVTGVLSTLLAWLACGNIIRRFGWTLTALITPLMLLIASGGFFLFYFCPKDSMALLTAAMGTTPLAMIVLMGSVQNILSRSCKYTLFDETKEMAYIPLPRDSRIKGKAAIDGVGSRLGKSGGSLAYQGLLIIFTTIMRSAPYVAAIMMVVFTGWIFAIRGLGKQFQALVHGKERLSGEEEEAATQAAAQAQATKRGEAEPLARAIT